MPAPKAHRQSIKRNARNMSVRRATRTAVVQARRSLSIAAPESEAAVRHAVSMLDVAVRKGVLHRNNASRRKARLAAALNRVRAI